MKIFIFVRKGCCLCETLKNKITKINLEEIKPKLEINEIDIDRFDLYQDKYKKFDNEVPVVAIKESKSQQITYIYTSFDDFLLSKVVFACFWTKMQIYTKL